MIRTARRSIAFLLFAASSLALTGCGREDERSALETVSPRTAAEYEGPFAGAVSLDEFPTWLKQHLASLEWDRHPPQRRLDRHTLQESLGLGRQFLLNNQRPQGNFNYQYDFVRKWMDPSDNQVRQAGALWGIALTYQYEQDSATKSALEKGLEFFFLHTKPGPTEGTLFIRYPGDENCQTGCVVLVALSIIEYLRTEKAGKVKLSDAYRKTLTGNLEGYLEFLKSMRLEDKHFSRTYTPQTEYKWRRWSPYFDGETMLCLIKAAKYLGYTDLVPLIEDSAMVLAKEYTLDQWRLDPDSDLTKGFFQWSCMAFWEYQDAGWKDADTLGDYVLTMAWWMVHTHETLGRNRNTAYAYEGIIHAYRLAQAREDDAALNELAHTIDEALFKLTSWQVGGPLQSENAFLTANPTNDPLAVGGIMNHRKEAPLRIDVTQHQMHAVILARRYIYR